MRDIGFKIFVLFIVSWFMHLASRIPILGIIRFDLILIIMMGIITITISSNEKYELIIKNKTSKILVILICYIILTIPVVEWPGTVVKLGIGNFIKAIVFYYFTIAFITTEKRLKIIIIIFTVCQTIRVLEPLYLHITEGYWGGKTFMSGEFMNRLAGGPFDFINPNGLAYIIVSVIPFYYFFGSFGLKYKIAAIIIIPIMIYALVLTASRSGMLALFVVVVGIFIKSKYKYIIGFIIAIAFMFSLSHLNIDQIDRYTSIVDSNSRNASTYKARIEGVYKAFKIALNRPIVGHGLGTSLEASWEEGKLTVMAHNLYAQIAQELGFVGLAIFLFYMKSIVLSLIRIAKITKKNISRCSGLKVINDAILVWVAMNFLFSLASYGLSGYAWYFIGGLAVVMEKFALMNNTDYTIVRENAIA